MKIYLSKKADESGEADKSMWYDDSSTNYKYYTHHWHSSS